MLILGTSHLALQKLNFPSFQPVNSLNSSKSSFNGKRTLHLEYRSFFYQSHPFCKVTNNERSSTSLPKSSAFLLPALCWGHLYRQVLTLRSRSDFAGGPSHSSYYSHAQKMMWQVSAATVFHTEPLQLWYSSGNTVPDNRVSRLQPAISSILSVWEEGIYSPNQSLILQISAITQVHP